MINWKRTGKKEYPKEGQKCLIYFYATKFSLSIFTWEDYIDNDGNPAPEMGRSAVFSDKGGWLGDEDVLWVPLKELGIPDDYKNDKKFKKWDDPEKVYRYVEVIEDLHYKRNPENKRGYNLFDLEIPKGSKLGIISDKTWKNDGILTEEKYSEVWQCIYNDGVENWIVYIASEQIKELQ